MRSHIIIVFLALSLVYGIKANEGESGELDEGVIANDDYDVGRTEEEEEEEEENEEELLTINLKQGQVKGFKEESRNGKSFFTYHGIPYAQPPVGAFRLKDPQPADTWNGLLDGTHVPDPCLQIPFGEILVKPNPEMIGVEDCLVLSVHTPKPKNTTFLPVMVFIHGGAYFSGGIVEYPPHVLLNEDIVLVVIQYRLGVLGFMSTEDDVMPGNLGLKDQTLALRWVQENIGNFGGDNLLVTLFGESAGGASIHYQILSHQNLGLFKRAILQSGTAHNSWALGGAFTEAAHIVGEKFSCSIDKGSEVLLECLQSVEAVKLAATFKDFMIWTILPFIFGPRIDGKYLAAGPDLLMKEARHKKLDVMTGITRDEGSLLVYMMYVNEGNRNAIKYNFELNGPISLDFSEGDIAPLNQSLQIFHRYLQGINIDEDSLENMNKMYGDSIMNIAEDTFAMLYSKNIGKKHKLYYYQLDKRPSKALGDDFNLSIGKHWVTHGDDLCYLFDGGATFPVMDDEADLKLRDLMVTLWTNFAKIGNPTPDDSLGFIWEPVNQKSLHHLSIDTKVKMADDLRKEDREFWYSLPLQQNLILHPDKVKNLVTILENEEQQRSQDNKHGEETEDVKMKNKRKEQDIQKNKDEL